jgi:hypothetical protein
LYIEQHNATKSGHTGLKENFHIEGFLKQKRKTGHKKTALKQLLVSYIQRLKILRVFTNLGINRPKMVNFCPFDLVGFFHDPSFVIMCRLHKFEK